MKRIINLILFVCLFTNKMWGQTGNDSLVFNAYWQQVYDVVSTNTTINQTIVPRLRTFSTQPEKYFGEIPADKKRLFAANLRTFFITYIMESYNSLFKGKIKTNLKEKDTENILKFFYHTTDHRQKETKAIFQHSLNGEAIDYPEYFYKESEAIYPGGEKEAIKFISENMIYTEGEHPKGTQKITLSIDENGKAAIIYNRFFKKVQLPFLEMPNWQPAKRTDGKSTPTTISLEIPTEGIKATPFFSTEHSVKSYILSNLSLHQRNILSNKELKITFAVNKDGKASGPFDITTDTLITVFNNLLNYHQIKRSKVDISQNLKDSIKIAILNMPIWSSPAMSESGNPLNAFVTYEQYISKNYDTDDNRIYMAFDDNTKKITFEKEVPENAINPEFPGGLHGLVKYLSNNVKYPSICQENGIQGKVVAQFILSEDGIAVNPAIVKSVDPYLDREVIRLIRAMPKWKPAMIGNTPTQVSFTLPVTFHLR